jgi:hypothetical protein
MAVPVAGIPVLEMATTPAGPTKPGTGTALTTLMMTATAAASVMHASRMVEIVMIKRSRRRREKI